MRSGPGAYLKTKRIPPSAAPRRPGLFVSVVLYLTLPVLLASPAPLPAQEVVELPASDRPFASELEELYSVGGLNAEPWEEFQAVNNAVFAPDGRLYLLDAPAHAVFAISPAGEFLHRVGRPGEGPGEHDNASGLAVLPDGRVVIWDFGKRAFLLFDEAGEPLEEVRPDFGAGIPDDPFAVTAEGDLLALPFGPITSSNGGISYLSTSGILPARDGLPLLRVPLANGAATEVVVHADLLRWTGSGRSPIHRAFQPHPSWGPLAGGSLALHDSEGYRVEILGPDGTPRRILTRPLEPRPTNDGDRDAYARDLRSRFERGEIITMGPTGGGANLASRVREQLEETWFYPRITPVLEITADGRGHVWVQRRDEDDPTRPGPVDVLSAEGRYVATLPAGGPGLPTAFGPDGLVVFVETGEFDVPVARVYRLPPELR